MILNWYSKRAISRCIDEGRPLPDRLARRVKSSPELGRFYARMRDVDAALSGSAPMVAAPSRLDDRIREALLSAPEPGASVRSWARLTAGLALCGMALAGVVVGVRLMQGPVVPERTIAVEPSGGPTAETLTRAINDLPRLPGRTLMTSVEAPLRAEARLFVEDARRAADTVIARLPLPPLGRP